ncbi:hypothetical protein J6S39_00310 [Candidatus Saccharibacteria bacterium]|nr:hypothetical protein [Candidatus Saccharibacteria bacterium]
MIKRIGNYRVASFASFKKFFFANFCEIDDERLLKAIHEHMKLIFKRDFMYSQMSPRAMCVEFEAEGYTQDEYAEALWHLGQKVYMDSDFYARPIGAFGGAMPDAPNGHELIMHIALRLLAENNWQLIKKFEGYEMPVEKFSRCIITKFINIASVRTARDLHVYMWLIMCIHDFIAMEPKERRYFYFTHKIGETKDPEVIHGHAIKAKMFKDLILKQNYEDLGIYVPGQLFGLETALPEMHDIFYQMMNSAVRDYEKKKI